MAKTKAGLVPVGVVSFRGSSAFRVSLLLVSPLWPLYSSACVLVAVMFLLFKLNVLV